jgi:hypothetical protein
MIFRSSENAWSFDSVIAAPQLCERASLNASNLLVRYSIQRSEGYDFQVQFLRDADDMPRALSISGKVIPSSRPASAREVACTPNETMGL